MAFDLCEHQKVQIVLKAGAIIRELKNLSEEKNITTLYNETASLLGIIAVSMSSKTADHLPHPDEMKDEFGKFILPNKLCPKCGKTTFLSSICQSCKDAEDGKYKSGYTCDERQGGCGFVDDKTSEWIIQRLERMKREGKFSGDIPIGTKESLGIKTITNDGLR